MASRILDRRHSA